MSRIETILDQATISQLDSRPAPSVTIDTTLAEVCRKLDEGDLASVLVLQGRKLLGIFTQRDVLYLSSKEKLSPEVPISQVMTRHPESLGPSQPLGDAIELMVDRGYRQVPLVDEQGNAVGLLTSRDVLSFVASHYPEAVLNLPPRLHQVMLTPEGG